MITRECHKFVGNVIDKFASKLMIFEKYFDNISKGKVLGVTNFNVNTQTYPQCHGMSNAKLGYISSPERLEVVGETNPPSSIHFCSLSIQFG